MSRSWRTVTPEIARSVNRSPLITERTGYRYFVLPTGGKIEQLEMHADDDRYRLSRAADYIVGSGNHAIALVDADHGYLTELPVGWFRAAGAWKLNPGYELKNHRFSRPITAGCVACHATSTGTPLAGANHFPTPIQDGIDCSRCHGDDASHAAFWTRSDGEEPPVSAKLVHPGALSPALANDVCLQCHLQGDVTIYRGGHAPLDFRPGQRLLEQRYDFLIAGQPDALGLASHGARMLQSRCYTASAGQLTCIDCHDAHQPAAEQPRAVYDAACAKCHQPEVCSRPDPPPGIEKITSCTGCHMPQRSTREGIHLIFTDHAIPRLPGPASEGPPPLLGPNYNAAIISAWPNVVRDDAMLGAAHVLFHETMGPQVQSLELACSLLANAVRHDPADYESRYWLGSAWLARRNATESLVQLGKVVKQQPDNYLARFRLALAHEAAGDGPAAIAEYERLLKDAPSWLEPYTRLAQLYLSRQRPNDSARVLREQIDHQPSAGAYAALALSERLAGRPHQLAFTTLEQAMRLDSRLPAAYITRGTLWLLAGDMARAQGDYQHALQLDPTSGVAQEALRTLNRTR